MHEFTTKRTMYFWFGRVNLSYKILIDYFSLASIYSYIILGYSFDEKRIIIFWANFKISSPKWGFFYVLSLSSDHFPLDLWQIKIHRNPYGSHECYLVGRIFLIWYYTPSAKPLCNVSFGTFLSSTPLTLVAYNPHFRMHGQDLNQIYKVRYNVMWMFSWDNMKLMGNIINYNTDHRLSCTEA